MLKKGDTLPMGDYWVTYAGKIKEGVYWKFKIDYFLEKGPELKYQFSLYPVVQMNPMMGNVAEPSTKHFFHKDIYTHITFAELDELQEKQEEYSTPKNFEVGINDTIFTSEAALIFKGINKDISPEKYQLNKGDIAVEAVLSVIDIKGKEELALPALVIKNNKIISPDFIMEKQGIRLNFVYINPETAKITLQISERNDKKKDFIILKAIVFPWINVLWAGIVLMVIGGGISFYRRFKRFIL
jgi:cytochrome c-type biogenesis protein CcmF